VRSPCRCFAAELPRWALMAKKALYSDYCIGSLLPTNIIARYR
jgi:hypothetical protein